MADTRLLKDRVFTVLALVLSALGILPLLYLLITVGYKGAGAILRAGAGFFTMPPAPPGDDNIGGIAPAIAGSMVLALLSTATGIPIALFTALFLHEFRSTRYARIVRAFLMSLLEIPTILVGILVYTILVLPLQGFSLFAGAAALAIVMLPYVTVYIERAFDSVPQTYREAGFALGMTRMQVALRVTLGVARRGVLAGAIIGLSKAFGETAPLLFTIGGSRSGIQVNPAKPGDAMPLLIFQFASTPYANWHDAAWGASLVLLVGVLLVYLLSRKIIGEVNA